MISNAAVGGAIDLDKIKKLINNRISRTLGTVIRIGITYPNRADTGIDKHDRAFGRPSPREARRRCLLQLLISKITVLRSSIELNARASAILDVLIGDGAGPESSSVPDGEMIVLFALTKLKRTGQEVKNVVDGPGGTLAILNQTLVKLIAKSQNIYISCSPPRRFSSKIR